MVKLEHLQYTSLKVLKTEFLVYVSRRRFKSKADFEDKAGIEETAENEQRLQVNTGGRTDTRL